MNLRRLVAFVCLSACSLWLFRELATRLYFAVAAPYHEQAVAWCGAAFGDWAKPVAERVPAAVAAGLYLLFGSVGYLAVVEGGPRATRAAVVSLVMLTAAVWGAEWYQDHRDRMFAEEFRASRLGFTPGLLPLPPPTLPPGTSLPYGPDNPPVSP